MDRRSKSCSSLDLTVFSRVSSYVLAVIQVVWDHSNKYWHWWYTTSDWSLYFHLGRISGNLFLLFNGTEPPTASFELAYRRFRSVFCCARKCFSSWMFSPQLLLSAIFFMLLQLEKIIWLKPPSDASPSPCGSSLQMGMIASIIWRLSIYIGDKSI